MLKGLGIEVTWAFLLISQSGALHMDKPYKWNNSSLIVTKLYVQYKVDSVPKELYATDRAVTYTITSLHKPVQTPVQNVLIIHCSSEIVYTADLPFQNIQAEGCGKTLAGILCNGMSTRW